MWRSELYNRPDEPGYGDNDLSWDEQVAKYNRWVERVLSEPWVEAIREVVSEEGIWIGTEAELLREVRQRVPNSVLRSDDFPSTPQALIYNWEILFESCFCPWPLIRDYNKIIVQDDVTEEELRISFNAPDWGPDAPLFLQRGDAASAKRFYDVAAQELINEDSVFALAVLALTFRHQNKKGTGGWEGRTKSLTSELEKSNPLDPIVSRVLRAKGVEQIVDEHSDWDLLYPTEPREFKALHRKLKECARIVGCVGIEMKCERNTSLGRTNKGIQYWTIKAPEWHM